MEIFELHHKLYESQAGAKIPALPIDINTLPPPPKRKSTFLNTLSRLASPTSGKSGRHSRQATTNIHPSRLPTPLGSPSIEVLDPFTIESVTNGTNRAHTNGSSTITGLAAYLTTISNTPAVRQARVWKRFVRVRTDDLESVRVERAIKHARSDLASHVSPKTPVESKASSTKSISGDVQGDKDTENGICGFVDEHMQELLEDEDDHAALKEDAAIARAMVEDLSAGDLDSRRPAETSTHDREVTEKPAPPPSSDAEEPVVDGVDAVEEVQEPTSVITEVPVGRTQRSYSADPDKSRRPSRVYATSAQNVDGASSQTGDESSVSTTDKRRVARKKRSMSTDPNRKKSQRKVVIDDFEMMRVLGKGCAGKVLLVRHKSTADLYALKAITKRHVLAHQELQHTLTEQAVLKRMAAESKDPFVVKLWWSFHDKENLFLVMVCPLQLLFTCALRLLHDVRRF
jgi:serum/glucocorticoid-regulated kinase 2